jgi:hypothetical protein
MTGSAPARPARKEFETICDKKKSGNKPKRLRRSRGFFWQRGILGIGNQDLREEDCRTTDGKIRNKAVVSNERPLPTVGVFFSDTKVFKFSSLEKRGEVL